MEFCDFSLGDSRTFYVSNLLSFVVFVFFELHRVVFISSFINKSKVEESCCINQQPKEINLCFFLQMRCCAMCFPWETSIRDRSQPSAGALLQ